MDLIKTLVKAFFLPPGIFIVLAVGYSSWSLMRRHYLRGFSFFILGVVAWALSTVPVSDALLNPLEKGLTIPEKPMGDVVIVLGAGVSSERPDPLGRGGPSQTTLARIVAGARISNKLDIPLLFSGRGNSIDAESTRRVIMRYLGDLGVENSRIFIENQSKDTYENTVFSAKICREKGFKRPILVTSGYHMKRAVRYFKNGEINVLPFPSTLTSWSGRKYTWVSYLPGNFYRSTLALHEYLGLLYCRSFRSKP